MRSIISRKLVLFWQSFLDVMSNGQSFHLQFKDFPSLQDVFDKKNKNILFENKEVVLIIDEIDSLSDLDDQTRKYFLGALSSIKQTKDIYCLWSCLFITNWMGPYIYDTLGSSPFPLSDYVISPYFTSEETSIFLKEVEKEYIVKIEDNIKENIYEITEGAQGLVVILTLYYIEECTLLVKELTYEEWYNLSLSSKIWKYIQKIDNFKKMTNALENNIEAKQELIKYICGKRDIFTLSSLNILIKSNIIKITKLDYNWASIFVEKYIKGILYGQEISNINVPIDKDKNIIFEELISRIIEQMNSLSIIGAEKKTNLCKSTSLKGPKEITYSSEFNQTLKRSIGDVGSIQ